jgi:hypothetical protein
MAEEKIYFVTFREVCTVTERVWASSRADAIRRVKGGLGERTDQSVDESRSPVGHRAEEG